MSGPRRPRVRFGQDRPATFDDFITRHDADTGDWIAIPDAARRYWAGAPIPIVGAHEFTVLPSGVAVPTASTRGPQPIDLMQVFLKAEEVFGGRLGLPFVEAELREVARDALLVRCAKILGAYDRMQANRETLDEGLVAGWFTEPTATKVRERLRRDRRLFAPQALLMLMRLAIVHSPEQVPEGRPHRFPATPSARKELAPRI